MGRTARASGSKSSRGVHEDFDYVFFMGDLNTRIDASRSDVDSWLAEGQLGKCLERDQLLPLLHWPADREGNPGMWPIFNEHEIRFPPTYKFDTQSEQYDTSKKQRVPSWTDRILWKRNELVRPLRYDAIQTLQYSDHRPVFAQFEVTVNLDNWTGPVPKERSSAVCVAQ